MGEKTRPCSSAIANTARAATPPRCDIPPVPDLTPVLQSKDLLLMLWTATLLGFLHTLAGPDHYVPFVMMGRAERWPLHRTMGITFLCGLGHVGSSIVVGLALGWVGLAAAQWEGSTLSRWHAWRGDMTAWILMGVGVALAIHGLIQTVRGRAHTHAHAHDSEDAHIHDHTHESHHVHVHAAHGRGRRLTPWVLFVIFIFGPCESLVPLMLAATAASGIAGSLLVAMAFSLTTVITILVTVSILYMGFEKFSLGFLERHATALAGVSLVFCGAAMRFMGL